MYLAGLIVGLLIVLAIAYLFGPLIIHKLGHRRHFPPLMTWILGLTATAGTILIVVLLLTAPPIHPPADSAPNEVAGNSSADKDFQEREHARDQRVVTIAVTAPVVVVLFYSSLRWHVKPHRSSSR